MNCEECTYNICADCPLWYQHIKEEDEHEN